MNKNESKRLAALGAALIVALMPAVAMASDDAHGHGFPWVHLITSFVNFGVFLGVLIKFGGPKIQEHFAARRAQLVNNLEESKRLREAAQVKLDEYSARLEALEAERDGLLKEYKAQGERERDKLIEDAKRQVEKMGLDAEKAIEQETKKAIQVLERRAVMQAVELAEAAAVERLKGANAQDALVDGFVSELSGLDVFKKSGAQAS
jgi:F-type H+-transporting ATPase subunit b